MSEYTLQGKSSSFTSNVNVVRTDNSEFKAMNNLQSTQLPLFTPQYSQEQLNYMKKSKNNVICQSNFPKYSLQGSSHPNESVKTPTNLHNVKNYNQNKSKLDKAVNHLKKSHILLQGALRHVPGGEAIVGTVETAEVILDRDKSSGEKTAEVSGIAVKSALSFVPHGRLIGFAAGKVVEDNLKKVIE